MTVSPASDAERGGKRLETGPNRIMDEALVRFAAILAFWHGQRSAGSLVLSEVRSGLAVCDDR